MDPGDINKINFVQKLEVHVHETNRIVVSLHAAEHCISMPTYLVGKALVKTRSPLKCSRVAQWERAGPITQRSMDRNHPLLPFFSFFSSSQSKLKVCYLLCATS